MPYKDPARQREYMRQWTERRRAEWFAGKSCAECGSTEDLELDHVDPARKVSHRVWSWAKERREAELAKCRALCGICHAKKTGTEQPHGAAKVNARLTEEQVHEIRASTESCRALAAKYPVNFSTVSKVRRGAKWRRLEPSNEGV